MTIDPVGGGYCRVLMKCCGVNRRYICTALEAPMLVAFNMSWALFLERRFESYRIKYIVGEDRMRDLEKQFYRWALLPEGRKYKKFKLRDETRLDDIREEVEQEEREEEERKQNEEEERRKKRKSRRSEK